MKMYAITASVNMDEEATCKALAALGFVDIQIEQVISIDEYLATLSSKPTRRTLSSSLWTTKKRKQKTSV